MALIIIHLKLRMRNRTAYAWQMSHKDPSDLSLYYAKQNVIYITQIMPTLIQFICNGELDSEAPKQKCPDNPVRAFLFNFARTM